MNRRIKLVHDWAAAKLVVEDDEPKGGWPMMGALYDDFRLWGATKPEIERVTAPVFGRHVRNLAGLIVKRRSHGAVAIGVRLLRDGDEGATFIPKMKMIGVNLTQEERTGIDNTAFIKKSALATVSMAALELITHSENIDATRVIAFEALETIKRMTGKRERARPQRKTK